MRTPDPRSWLPRSGGRIRTDGSRAASSTSVRPCTPIRRPHLPSRSPRGRAAGGTVAAARRLAAARRRHTTLKGGEPEADHGRRHKRKRHATETQGSGRSEASAIGVGTRAPDRHNRRAAAKQRRSKHRARRATRFFNGYAEPGGQVQPGDRNESVAPKQRPADSGAGAAASLDDGVDASVMVPAVMTLAALTLAGTALLRRRRLASRAGRNT